MATGFAGFDAERDRLLVQRHQAGESDAFGQLYQLYYGPLVRFCRSRGLDPHTAEEITQDAFVRAYNAVGRLAGERLFYPWLRVIAARLASNHHRAHRRRVWQALEIDIASHDTPERACLHDLDTRQFAHILQRLPQRHRDVLRLRAEGLSYDDIGRRLDLPVSAVRPLLHRARGALRREWIRTTAGERISALAPALLTDAARRLRAAHAPALNALADLSAVALPAGLALAIALTAGPTALPPHNNGAITPAQPPPTATPAELTPIRGPAAHAPGGAPTAAAASGSPAVPDPTRTEVAGLASVQNGPGRQTDQDRARQMPHYYEAGPFFFGFDHHEAQRQVRDAIRLPATGPLARD